MNILILLASLFTVTISGSDSPIGVPVGIVETSVKVDDATSNGFGSGVIFNNKKYTYVWTAAHVLSDNQVIKKVLDARTGKEKISIIYKDAWVNQIIVEDGRKVGERKFLAKIIRYSKKEDLVLLKVYATNRFKASAKFTKALPKVGMDIWAVGSPKGNIGYTSVNKGVLSALGRLRLAGQPDDTNGIIYDQVCVAAAPGSSGCGVYLPNKECIGIMTEYLHTNWSTPGMFCIVPTRRLLDFACRNNCLYAVDETVPVPRVESVITDDDYEIKTPVSPK